MFDMRSRWPGMLRSYGESQELARRKPWSKGRENEFSFGVSGKPIRTELRIPGEHLFNVTWSVKETRRSDQPFDERMGHGYVWDRLDLFDLEYAGKPPMETE